MRVVNEKGVSVEQLLQVGFVARKPAVEDMLSISEVMATLKRAKQTASEFYQFCRHLKDNGKDEISVSIIGEKIRPDTATFLCVYFIKGVPHRSGALSTNFFPNQKQYVAKAQEALKKSKSIPHAVEVLAGWKGSKKGNNSGAQVRPG